MRDREQSLLWTVPVFCFVVYILETYDALKAEIAKVTATYESVRQVYDFGCMDDFDKYKSSSSDTINIAEQEIRIELDATDSSIKLSLVFSELSSITLSSK